MNFFAELKRRNVYKVAVAYAVVSWLVLQAASLLFVTFEAATWAMKIFVVAVALGFPTALVLAWAFEITPQGIKRAEDVDLNSSITHKTGRELAVITAALAVIAAGLFILQHLRSKSSTSAAVAMSTINKSIAVLPFDNLSEEKGNAYFAEGIQEKLRELRAQRYSSAYSLALVPLGLGDVNEALDWLEQGYQERDGDSLGAIRIDPILIPLHGNPRFEALAEKIAPAREFGKAVAPK